MRKNKIRILHVAQAAGGVDRYIRMLLKYLDKEKFENILVCSQDFHEEDYRDLVDSFEQVEMTRAIGGNDLKAIKEVRTLIKKYNPDIVYSPHIASKFEPASIVRLYSENKYSFASCGGCSELLKSVFDNFGYRLNALSAETFFSDGVFLVEGTSEVLFYTALARELKLDLDRHNISILSVEGVGFKPYVAICNALNISWVLRTDNDIFSKTSVTSVKKYYAGISRGIGIVKDIGDNKTGCRTTFF